MALSWAAAADAEAPDVDLKIAPRLGLGQPQVNAAGDILLSGRADVPIDGAVTAVPLFARADRDGNVLWSRGYGSREAFLFGALQADGGVLVAGTFAGALNLGGVQLESALNPPNASGSAWSADETYRRGGWSRDVVAFGLDARGGLRWAERYGGAGDQSVHAITLSPSGGLMVVGEFVGRLQMGEQELVSRGGSTKRDLFVAQLAATGTPLSLWREDALHVDAIAMGADGALWLAGRTSGLEDNEAQLIKLGRDGQRQWAVPMYAYPTGLAVDAQGSAYMVLNPLNPNTQVFERTILGNDGTLLKVSAQGELEWLREIEADFSLSSVAVDAFGNVALAGNYRGSIDFGAGALPSAGDTDMFFASFTPDSALRYSLRLGGQSFDGAGLVTATTTGWLAPIYIGQRIPGTQLPEGEHLLWLDEQR